MEIKIITTILVCLGMFFGSTVNTLAPAEVDVNTYAETTSAVSYME